jgi:hypothetical protein
MCRPRWRRFFCLINLARSLSRCLSLHQSKKKSTDNEIHVTAIVSPFLSFSFQNIETQKYFCISVFHHSCIIYYWGISKEKPNTYIHKKWEGNDSYLSRLRFIDNEVITCDFYSHRSLVCRRVVSQLKSVILPLWVSFFDFRLGDLFSTKCKIRTKPCKTDKDCCLVNRRRMVCGPQLEICGQKKCCITEVEEQQEKQAAIVRNRRPNKSFAGALPQWKITIVFNI